MKIRIMIFFLIVLSIISSTMAVSGCTGIITGNSVSPTNGPASNPSVSPAATQAAIVNPSPAATMTASQSSFGDTDNGNEVSLHKGDVFTVTLTQAMGNSYTWDASTSPGLTITDSQFKDSNTAGIAGLGDSSQIWTVEVTSDGSQWFKAENKGGTITIATYTLNVDVN